MNEQGVVVEPENVDYNREYYEEHKEVISERRRTRYWTDSAYRARVQARSRKQYRSKSASKDKDIGYTVKMIDSIEVFTIKYVAQMTGKCEDTIRAWEAKGIIPKSTYTDKRGWRLYSSEQIQLLTVAFRKVDLKEWSRQDVQNYLAAHWQ